jgi:uncharacterized protein YjdB
LRNKKAVLLLFFIIVALLSSGCIFSGLFNRRPVTEEISDQIGKIGQEFTYQVIAYDPDNGELTYSLTEKPEGMQIGSSTGLITWTPGESQIGTFAVEVKVSNGNSFSVKQFKITIEIICLNSVEVSPAAINVYVGNSNVITSVTANYDNGGSIDLALVDCDYGSSNTGIATVSGSGVITGVSAGTATITVSYTEDGITKTDTVSVTVEDISLTSIGVSPAIINIYVGNSSTINSITAFYNDGSNNSITLSLATYQSNNTNIATVDNSGLVTGVSTGTAVITVIYIEGGITKADMIGVTVSEAPKVLTSIVVLPSSMSMHTGDSETIVSITAHYDDESNTTIGLDSASYSSNHTGIASVNTTGRVTGVSAGSATITATYTEGGITKTDTVEVTVSQAPKVLTSIIVLPSTMSIRKGQSQTITSITAYYNDASSANIELSACNYQSNVTNVTVTNGVIKVSSTCAATTAIITVSYTEGGVTKSDTVNVTITGGG